MQFAGLYQYRYMRSVRQAGINCKGWHEKNGRQKRRGLFEVQLFDILSSKQIKSQITTQQKKHRNECHKNRSCNH